MDKEKTGKMIRQARIDKGYTQSELGDMIGVSNKAISRWENGETFPDIGVIEPLAQMLELRIQDIITGTKDSDQDTAIAELAVVLILLTALSFIICAKTYNSLKKKQNA